jgi:Predicted restriction endonuclease
MTALSPLAEPCPAPDGTPDPRTPSERQGAGLIELARRMCEVGSLPTEMGGQKPHLIITIAEPVLKSGTGTALLDFGDSTLPGTTAAEDARRLACDAHRTRIRLDRHGNPLDVGRSSYTVPRRIRRALHQRDHGCAFPGCTIPPQWADAHHIRHWADGGPTALHNLVLLCPAHHTLLHNSDWTCTLVKGFPVFHPPPWQHAPPRTNPLHRPDLATAGRRN